MVDPTLFPSLLGQGPPALPAPPGGAPMGGPPMEPPMAPVLRDELGPPAPPDLSTDPFAIAVEDPVNRVRLDRERQDNLMRRMLDICQAYDGSMMERRQRELQITRAYDQIPESEQAGQQPGASHLVSEITRVHTTTAEARITGSLRSVTPYITCTVVGSQVPKDADAELYMKIATAIQDFMAGYFYDMGLDRLWPQDIRRASKVGTAIKRIMWEEKVRIRRYRDRSGGLKDLKTVIGGIKWRLVNNENVIVWPLHETDCQELQVAGHRTWMVESAFVAWAKAAGVSAADVDRIVSITQAGGEMRPPEEEERLKNKDIRYSASENPFRGQVKITELWITVPLDDDDRSLDPRYRIVFHEDTRILFLVENNPHWSGQHPYWKTPYLEEDGSFWASGVGHEVLYEQAAGSALRNILIDNLKTIAHHVRIYKLHSQAASHMSSVSPGYEFATEDPEGDFKTVALGGDLSLIYEALADNDARASRNSGVTELLMGRGDPVMKTRASASGYQQLIAESGKKFGGIDATMRTELSRMLMHCLHLLAQYGTYELFATILPAEQASLMVRIKDMPFVGLLDRVFKLECKAPSAGANEESLKQNLLVIYNMALQHVQAVLPLAQQVMGQTNPAGFMTLQSDLLETVSDLFAKIVELHQTGVAPPEIPGEPSPPEMVINQLLQQLQQLQMAVQSASPPTGMGPGGPGGSSPAGPPGPGSMGPPPGPPPGPPMGPM